MDRKRVSEGIREGKRGAQWRFKRVEGSRVAEISEGKALSMTNSPILHLAGERWPTETIFRDKCE